APARPVRQPYQQLVIAAGGFHRDHRLLRQRSEPGGNAALIVGQVAPACSPVNTARQACLGYVDTDEYLFCLLHGCLLQSHNSCAGMETPTLHVGLRSDWRSPCSISAAQFLIDVRGRDRRLLRTVGPLQRPIAEGVSPSQPLELYKRSEFPRFPF